MLLLTVFWISGRCGHPGDNNNKSPEDESFVCVREEKNSFVLWVVGIAGRHAYVRDFVVCAYCLISSSYYR